MCCFLFVAEDAFDVPVSRETFDRDLQKYTRGGEMNPALYFFTRFVFLIHPFSSSLLSKDELPSYDSMEEKVSSSEPHQSFFK